MQRIRILSFCMLVLAPVVQLFAQEISVQLKVRESRLFGLKGERFAQVSLTSQHGWHPLDGDSVNAGTYYYFLVRPAGDWVIDADFVQEDLPKLVILQGERTFQIAWSSEVLTDSAGTSIRVGFPKEVKLFKPFTVQFGLDGESSRSTLTIPPGYWPGFSALRTGLRAAEKAAHDQRLHEAIRVYELLLRADSLAIFPEAADLRSRRTQCFGDILARTWSSFLALTVNQSDSLKERIAGIDRMMPEVQFVSDSLPSPSLGIAAADSLVKPLIGRANEILTKMHDTRATMKHSLDDQTIRWIIEGSATGKNGPHFELMIEALTYAFSSIDFSDTAARPLHLTLPPALQAGLARNKLEESYEIFIRRASERFEQRLTLYPPGFLGNLMKDTSSFPLSFPTMLKTVEDFTIGAYPAALAEIRSILRTCYEPELSRRFDQMRSIIGLRLRPDRTELSTLLQEAAAAEQSGDKDAASERYTSALRIAPDFGYAAYLCGRLYARGGDLIRARSFYERAFQLDSLCLNAYRDAWSLYQASGNYKAMIDVLKRAIRAGNDSWETNINLGIAYLGDGNLPQAVKEIERALEFNPTNYQTNVQLGLAYQAAKDFQKARDYFNKAIFIDPRRLEAVEALQKLDELQKSAK